jgi:hypothetical protein
MKPRSLSLALVLALGASSALAQQAGPYPTLDRLEAAWGAHDVAAYLALWEFPDAEARADERFFAEQAFAWEQSRLLLERPSSLPAGAQVSRVSGRIVSIREPNGRVDQWVFVLEQRGGAWPLVRRLPAGRIDGLVHLTLDPAGYRADGLTLKLEDFELVMSKGTLFTSPESLGPTVAVFAGDATVRMFPRPPTEREQLRQFSGKTELVQKLDAFFLRVHPSELARVLTPAGLERDPGAAGRYAAAQRFYAANVSRSFVLDANLPGSPWSVMPSLGDALVAFQAGHLGLLTYTVTADQAEGISLFDRNRRRQICLYPAAGSRARYSDDDARPVDVLSHDLRVRFEPHEEQLEGEDTLRLRLLAPVATIRLKLDERLRVDSIRSAEGGRLLFFRVRNQDSVMVSLGAAAASTGEIAFTVKYGGTLSPGPVESEAQGVSFEGPNDEESVYIEKVLVYSNRSAWYPQTPNEDYATATMRLDVPAGFSAVTGGERVAAHSDGQRAISEYRLSEPGKYFSVVVGRLTLSDSRSTGPVALAAFGGPRARDDAEKVIGLAEPILSFFTEQFGPCPYSHLNLVTIEGEVPGGHSPPGMVVVARRPILARRPLRDDPTNFSDIPGFFLAHELAHQWWGQGVAGQNYRERWLSEGAAQYAAALWARQAYGEDVFQSILKRMGRWAFKESDEGPIHLGYRLGHLKGDPTIYRALVYDKGAYVLHMLRGVVGDAPFRAALADFQARFRFAKADSDDLREALERASGADLSAYFREWVLGTALPTLSVAQRATKVGAGYQATIEVKAQNLPGPVPLELALVHERGRVTQRVLLSAEGGSFTIDAPTRPSRVLLNGDRALLAAVKGS